MMLVITVSKQANVKSGSNSDLFLSQRITSVIYSHRVPRNINQTQPGMHTATM